MHVDVDVASTSMVVSRLMFVLRFTLVFRFWLTFALRLEPTFPLRLPPPRSEVDAGNRRVRRSLLEESAERVRLILARTPQLAVPVLPISTAQDVSEQVRRLLGAGTAPRRGSGGVCVNGMARRPPAASRGG
jgi:hypothetical protein